MPRIVGILIIAVLMVSTIYLAPAQAVAPKPFLPLSSPVNHTMTVRVVLVGISDINNDELLWNLEPEIEPMIQVSNNPQGLSELQYGVKFKIQYDIVSATSEATNNLRDYLKSIAKVQKVPKFLDGYGAWSSDSDPSSYAVLDALETEDWMNTHVADFGSIPQDGYTLIVADMRDVSNLHHYYERRYLSLDAASQKAKYHSKPELFPIIDWMFSWGGRYGFYYLDLSGGDPKYDHSGNGHVPIQDFETKYYNNDQVKFKRNVHTVTEYVADYVAEAIRNLFLPSYVYSPTFAKSYKIVVNIFDDTGRLPLDNIVDYLSTDLVKKAFEAVIPYATWEISVNAQRLSDDGELEDVVSNSVLFSSGSITGTFGDKVYIDYYDYRHVYSYLQSHSSKYFESTTDSVVLPVFAFILKSSSRFAYTWQEQIGSAERAKDLPDNTFGGISLGDMVIIGRSERSIFDFGYEFSQITIHEVGHSIGLMHPHSYGWTEDYVSSAMSYSTYDYGFSQFDADSVQRGHADFYLSQIQGPMQAMSTATLQNSEAQSLVEQARGDYESAMSSYSQKEYGQATKKLMSLSDLLDQAFDLEINGIQDRISKTSVSDETAKKLLQHAGTLVDLAKTQREAGNLGAAYGFLAEASRAAQDALQIEAGAQEIARNAAAQFQTALLIGVAIGAAIGISAGFAFAKVMRSRRTKLS